MGTKEKEGQPQMRMKRRKSEDNEKKIEVYYEPAERDSHGIILGCM